MIDTLVHIAGIDALGIFSTLGAQLLTAILATFDSWMSGLMGPLKFSVLECDNSSCPGSAYNLITAAWANIGYMTHSDILHLLTETKLGLWAPILYMVGAIGALIGVAINTPPKTYIWFFLGPCLYWFLVNTQKPVTGVAWRVAGEMQSMKEVWKDAETGLANTALIAKRQKLRITKENGPSAQYPVAYPMLFLDRLFSASTSKLIGWIGIDSMEGTGRGDTNLAVKEGIGPWYILADLKWGMLENIVGVQARDPDVRDALVTFLTSECGDHFKKGVDSGRYIASSQSRGASLPTTVFKGVPNTNYVGGNQGGNIRNSDYNKFKHGMDIEVIPTPRSVIKLFNQDPGAQGSFAAFNPQLFDGTKADQTGRTVDIVCSEYLYVIVQALRWESGHAYWQLVRSAPNGFTRSSILKALFYGWDVRLQEGGSYASNEQMEAFVKQLIFVHLLRNELMYAPQVTEVGQRFAPSDQSRNFSESYVRTQGSKSKAAELYNWAVLMPHVQGILSYIVLVFYPFAAMLMVIPGYWKAFFTWVTFFAWIKLWDIGFAIVHTLERSVWAMIGNHSTMARVANMLIETSDQVGTVAVGQASDCNGTNMSTLCAVPDVIDNNGLSEKNAWFLLDKSMLLMGSADLDLSSGYYVYIMAALYFAVPAVTGQLVLGAKAGLGGLATQAIGQNAQEAGTASKQAAVGEAVNKLQTNQASLSQAAIGKSHRQNGLALQQLQTANQALDTELNAGRIGSEKGGVGAAADAKELKAKSYDSSGNLLKAAAGLGKDGASYLQPGFFPTPAASGTGTGTGGVQQLVSALGSGANFALAHGSNRLGQDGLSAAARSRAFGAQADWNAGAERLRGQGLNNFAQKLGAEAEFAAQSDAWSARNDFATHLAGLGGVSGLNPGALNPGQKPADATGLAMSGQIGGAARSAARYSGTGFLSSVSGMTAAGRSSLGASRVLDNWGGGVQVMDIIRTTPGSLAQDADGKLKAMTKSGWFGEQNNENTPGNNTPNIDIKK